MRKTCFTRLFKITSFLLLMGLSACNVFEGTHTVGSSNDPASLLIDADSEFAKDRYASAASLYLQVLTLEPTNSRAMDGYASVILFRDLTVSDIHIILTNIYSIQNVATSNEFNTNLAGIDGMSPAAYHSNAVVVFSNAGYYRSPIIGVDPGTGIISTNSSGVPQAANSDGVIPADDRTAMLNYIIVKTAHVAMYVQQQFKVYGNLVSGIDVEGSTNSFSIATQDDFTNSHIMLTNEIMNLSNSYIDVTNIVYGTSGNASLWNLLDVMGSYLMLLSNDLTNGVIGQDSYDKASDAISGLNTAITALAVSVTNDSSGIIAGFDALHQFRTNAEAYGASQGWMTY